MENRSGGFAEGAREAEEDVEYGDRGGDPRGGFVGVAAAFIVEGTDVSLKSAEEVEAVLGGLPVLATIPIHVGGLWLITTIILTTIHALITVRNDQRKTSKAGICLLDEHGCRLQAVAVTCAPLPDAYPGKVRVA